MRAVHYWLASFIFFPRATSLFRLVLLPSTADLSHSILSFSLFVYSSVSFFFFFSSSRPLLSSPSHIHTRSVVTCFNTCFAQKFTSRFADKHADVLPGRAVGSAIILPQRFLDCRVVNTLQSDPPRTILHAERDSFTPRVLARFRECRRSVDSDRSFCARRPKFRT